MIHQKKGSRALWAVAFAAAPIGAHATPLVNPQPAFNDVDQLIEIDWQNGASVVANKDTVIGARVSGVESKDGIETTITVPFLSTASSTAPTGWDIVEVKDAVTQLSTAASPASAASNVFASAQLTQGTSFSIDFGQFDPGVPPPGWDLKVGGSGTSTDPVGFVPAYSAFAYSGIGTLKDGKSQPVWITDFNLDLNATDTLTGDVLYQDYLGVQVISDASVLSASDQFSLSGGQLIFDPAFTGPTTVNLLSSPEPDPNPTPVPEPGSLALVSAALLGLAAAARRRKTEDPGGSEPEA